MRSAEREHYGLAVSCAHRFRDRGVPMEELIGEAEAALLWAASRFDESRGVRFSTYAVPVVLGALRELCRQNAPMHVPRSEVRILSQAHRARRVLMEQLHREPTLCEIADLTGIAAVRLGHMLAAQERMQHTQPDPDWSLVAGEGGFEDWVLCRETIRSLPAPYSQVLWMRCVLGRSQACTAQHLGVSQSHISRLEKEARTMLKQAMQE